MAYAQPYQAGAYGAGAGAVPPMANPMMGRPGPMGGAGMGMDAGGMPPAAAAVAAHRQQAALGGPGFAGQMHPAMAAGGGGMGPGAGMGMPMPGMGPGAAGNPMFGGGAGGAHMGMLNAGQAQQMGSAGATPMSSAAGFGGAVARGGGTAKEVEAEEVGEEEGAEAATAGRGVGRLGGASLYVVAILLPPLAVISTTGSGELLALNIFLTILGWLPGVFHAWFIVSRSNGSAAAHANS